MRICTGYTKTGKPVKINLVDGKVIITYILTGKKVKWNDETYSESDIRMIKSWLTAEGFRF